MTAVAAIGTCAYLASTVPDNDDIRAIVKEEYTEEIPVASPALKSLEYVFLKQIEEVAAQHRQGVKDWNRDAFTRYSESRENDAEFQDKSNVEKDYEFFIKGSEYKVVKKATGSYILACFLAASEDYLARFGEDETIDFFNVIGTMRKTDDVNNISNRHHGFFVKFLHRLKIAVETEPDQINNMWVHHINENVGTWQNLVSINNDLVNKMDLNIVYKNTAGNPYKLSVVFKQGKDLPYQFPNTSNR